MNPNDVAPMVIAITLFVVTGGVLVLGGYQGGVLGQQRFDLVQISAGGGVVDVSRQRRGHQAQEDQEAAQEIGDT